MGAKQRKGKQKMPYATGGNFDLDNKENLVTMMPKLFNRENEDRKEFSRPASANTNNAFSRPQSSMMRGARKERGLASRPTTANNTRSTTSMSGGKLVSRNGDTFVVINPTKASGYKKYPPNTSTNFLSTTKHSYQDPTPANRGK